jgi:hypothetical protein
MSLSIYNPSIFIIPCNLDFNRQHLERIQSTTGEAPCVDTLVRVINLVVGVGCLVLGPLVVIPARVICAIWNAVVGIFASLGGLIFQSVECQRTARWAFQDLASECHALISFVLAYPVLVTLSLAGTIIHSALASPAWSMLAYLSDPCSTRVYDVMPPLDDPFDPDQFWLPHDNPGIAFEPVDGPENRDSELIQAPVPERRNAEHLNNILEQGLFSDITLMVGEERLLAHKMILSVESPVLKEMIEGYNGENLNQLVIENTHPEAFKPFLRYLYTRGGDVSQLSIDRIRQLFALADHFQVEDLNGFLIHHLSTRLTDRLENYDLAVILNIAESQRNEQLKGRCEREFMRRLNRNNVQTFSGLADKYHLEQLQAECQAIQVN